MDSGVKLIEATDKSFVESPPSMEEIIGNMTGFLLNLHRKFKVLFCFIWKI